MGRFFRYIKSTKEIGDYSIINHCKDQPKNGSTIFYIKNTDTKETRLFFNECKKTIDRETKFTFSPGFKDGHPCVFFTFEAISSTINKNNYLICLETNTLTKKKHKNITSIYTDNHFEPTPKTELENIFWIDLNNIEIGKEYFIYIKTNPKSNLRHHYINSSEYYDDWKIFLNVRPTIRNKNGNKGHYNYYHFMPEYKKIEYFLKDEINI